MKVVSQLILTAIALASAACSQQTVNLQERLLEHDAEINEVIARMTLEEKVEMLHSKTNMSSPRGGRTHRVPVRRMAARLRHLLPHRIRPRSDLVARTRLQVRHRNGT